MFYKQVYVHLFSKSIRQFFRVWYWYKICWGVLRVSNKTFASRTFSLKTIKTEVWQSQDSVSRKPWCKSGLVNPEPSVSLGNAIRPLEGKGLETRLEGYNGFRWYFKSCAMRCPSDMFPTTELLAATKQNEHNILNTVCKNLPGNIFLEMAVNFQLSHTSINKKCPLFDLVSKTVFFSCQKQI